MLKKFSCLKNLRITTTTTTTTTSKKRFSTVSSKYLLKNTNINIDSYDIETDDGYILKQFRLVNRDFEGQKLKKCVHLQHGFLECSDSWLISGDDESLGIYLSNRGYDVWLGNCRGNKYSIKHKNSEIRRRDYWDFTFQEMAEYDLPAIMDFMVKEIEEGSLLNTSEKPINYVGFSQGTTQMFASLGDPKTSSKIQKYLDKFVALAPIISLRSQRAKILSNVSKMPGTEQLYKKFGSFPVLIPLLKDNSRLLAVQEKFAKKIPEFIITPFLLSEDKPEVNNTSNVAKYAGYCPAGSSYKSVLHWKQMMMSKKSDHPFKKFDYRDKKLNLERYGVFEPPRYDLGLLEVDLSLFYGEDDRFTDIEDKKILLKELERVGVDYQIKEFPDCGHMTFILGRNESQRMFVEIEQELER